MSVSVRRIALLAVTGVSLYLVAPALLDTFSSWQRLSDIWPERSRSSSRSSSPVSPASAWFERLALHRPRWLPVVTSQLGRQRRGQDRPRRRGGRGRASVRDAAQGGPSRLSTASGLTAGPPEPRHLFVLPLLAVPAILLGPPVPEDLLEGLWVALGALAVLFAVGAADAVADRPLLRVGAAIQAVRNSSCASALR